MYPKKNDLGERMQDIDRSYTHKMDPIKEYTESMLKIANMRRPGHWTFTKQSFTKKSTCPRLVTVKHWKAQIQLVSTSYFH